MWYALALVGWVVLRHFQGKPILPEWFVGTSFKSGAALASIPTPNGNALVAIPADTPVLSPGDPSGHPAEVFTLGSGGGGSVTVTIPQDTPIAHPMAAANAGLLEPRTLSLALALAGQSDVSIHAPRSLSSNNNPAAPPSGGGAGGGNAGSLAAALMGDFDMFDPWAGAGPHLEYPQDLDVPRSTSMSRVRFESR